MSRADMEERRNEALLDQKIAAIEDARTATPLPGDEERVIRRAEARDEARIYGEDRWY